MRESEELRELLLFLGQEIGIPYRMNLFKIEYPKMVDELAASHSELYEASPEPLEENPLDRLPLCARLRS